MAMRNPQAQRIADLIEDIDIAMFTTVGDDGYLVSRPLSTQAASFDGERVWFFTDADSPKVAEIRRNPKVNIAYASKDKNTYVSISGEAALSRNERQIDALWSDALKAFFPGGREDPDLALIEVRPRTAEYWDGPGSLLGKAITFLVARATRNDAVMAENAVVRMDGGTQRAPRTGAKRAATKGAAAKRSPAKRAPAKRSAGKVGAKAASKRAPAKRSPTTRSPARKTAASRRKG